jgi:hypothetical protein
VELQGSLVVAGIADSLVTLVLVELRDYLEPAVSAVNLDSAGIAVFPVLAGTLDFQVSRGSVDTADSREPPAYRDSLVRADIQAFPDTLASAGLLVQAVSVEHLAAVDIVVFQVIQVLVDIQEHLA